MTTQEDLLKKFLKKEEKSIKSLILNKISYEYKYRYKNDYAKLADEVFSFSWEAIKEFDQNKIELVEKNYNKVRHYIAQRAIYRFIDHDSANKLTMNVLAPKRIKNKEISYPYMFSVPNESLVNREVQDSITDLEWDETEQFLMDKCKESFTKEDTRTQIYRFLIEKYYLPQARNEQCWTMKDIAAATGTTEGWVSSVASDGTVQNFFKKYLLEL